MIKVHSYSIYYNYIKSVIFTWWLYHWTFFGYKIKNFVLNNFKVFSELHDTNMNVGTWCICLKLNVDMMFCFLHLGYARYVMDPLNQLCVVLCIFVTLEPHTVEWVEFTTVITEDPIHTCIWCCCKATGPFFWISYLLNKLAYSARSHGNSYIFYKVANLYESVWPTANSFPKPTPHWV